MSESKYKSEAMGAIHETMDSLYCLGVIDEEAMEHFDKACLVNPDYKLIYHHKHTISKALKKARNNFTSAL